MDDLERKTLEDIAPLQADLVGIKIANRYLLQKRLSRGGMGAVYEAEDLTLGMHVAVKILHPEFSGRGDMVGRFLQEAKLLARLHENIHIVNVKDFGVHDKRCYLVMELLHGRTLADAMSEGPISNALIVRVMRSVCDAMHVAHAVGIIHRDLKPENIFISQEHIVVLDFGIAKCTFGSPIEGQLTRPGEFVGTPEYMSPEQASGLLADGRSDIYSLGIILYEMLTGSVPFTATPSENALLSILAQHRIADPELPSKRNMVILPPLDNVVMRALSKNPDDRFQNMREFWLAFKTANKEIERAIFDSRVTLEKATLSTIKVDESAPIRILTPSWVWPVIIILSLLLATVTLSYVLHYVREHM